jgi:hypothetical protein
MPPPLPHRRRVPRHLRTSLRAVLLLATLLRCRAFSLAPAKPSSAAASPAALSADPGRIFSAIYARRIWGQEGGGSGLGSSLEYTRFTRVLLVHFLRTHNISSMLDAPCGSFLWMPAVVAAARRHNSGFSYTGLDVVQSVIAGHAAKHANASHLRFGTADLAADVADEAAEGPLPRGMDLVFTRDALQHLSEPQIRAVLRNVARAAPRFFMVGSYLHGRNVGIQTGDFFPIDLERLGNQRRL